MTTSQKINIESLLNYYNRRSDKEYDRMLRYEREGSAEKVKHAKLCSDLIDIFMDGIIETLKLLGYAVVFDSDHFIHIYEDE